MRSFIAINFSDGVKKALSDLQQELKQYRADIRWVKPENIHLTLKFLGSIDENSVSGIVEVLKGTCRQYPPFHIELCSAGVFPHVRSPRVVWTGMKENSVLAELQGAIEDGLEAFGIKKENRPFTPHITLGRFKSLKGKAEVLDALDRLKDRHIAAMDVQSVCLMKSELNASGARHSRVSEAQLSVSPGEGEREQVD